ncbi:MAG: hypothetical protein Q7U53_06060 [Anaerolineaceae bacterium]|nr:hypothetical protein [Anaerolineaceae bacterium]
MGNLSNLLSRLSSFFSNRKGLLIFVAIILIITNFIIGLLFNNWFSQSDLLLHLGIIIGLFGVMIAWAL